MNTDCLFCKILAGEIPANRIYEDEVLYCIPRHQSSGSYAPFDYSERAYCFAEPELCLSISRCWVTF